MKASNPMTDTETRKGDGIARNIVAGWIRSDDCPLAVKMMLTRQVADPLISAISAALAEARQTAGLGCDAANGGAHSIIKEGRYQFCAACGETVRSPALQERARAAEAEITRLEKAERAALDLAERHMNGKHAAEASLTRIRDEALEEAARLAEAEFADRALWHRYFREAARSIATAIRALKTGGGSPGREPSLHKLQRTEASPSDAQPQPDRPEMENRHGEG